MTAASRGTDIPGRSVDDSSVGARSFGMLLRVAGLGLLGATAYVHLDLWHQGYRTIPTIGPLFLINGIAAVALALALVVTRGRLLALAALGGALLEAGTLLGLIIATRHGLFGFKESTKATYYWQSVGIEIAGTLVLGLLAGIAAFQGRRSAGANPIAPLRRTAGHPTSR